MLLGQEWFPLAGEGHHFLHTTRMVVLSTAGSASLLIISSDPAGIL